MKLNIVLLLVSHLWAQKPSLLAGWAERPHRCPSGWWHIYQIQLDLEYWSGISDWQQNNLTYDAYMLPISARSSKVAEEKTPREHLVGRSRKLIWDTHVNIPSSISAAIFSVEELHPIDCDLSAVVDGKPGCTSFDVLCGAHVALVRKGVNGKKRFLSAIAWMMNDFSF